MSIRPDDPALTRVEGELTMSDQTLYVGNVAEFGEELALGEANGYLRPASPADLVAALVKAVEEGTIEGAELVNEVWQIEPDPSHRHSIYVDGPGTYVVVPVREEPTL